jgi:protein-S-isoprenylcysteine O-methyltransferase Ste14
MAGARVKWPPDLIITVLYIIVLFVTVVLMGTGVISNQRVEERLLTTLPATSAMVIAYWFMKARGGNGHKP